MWPLRKCPAASFFAFAMFALGPYGCSFFADIEPGNRGGSRWVHGWARIRPRERA